MLAPNLLRDEKLVEDLRQSEKARFRDATKVDLCKELFFASKKLEDEVVAINMIANKVNNQMKNIMTKKQNNSIDLSLDIAKLVIEKVKGKDASQILEFCLELCEDSSKAPQNQSNDLNVKIGSIICSMDENLLKLFQKHINASKKTKREEHLNSIAEFDTKWNSIGNFLDSRVFISDNEDNNPIINTFGDCSTRQKLTHIDICELIGGYDAVRGAKVMGSRGYFLKGPLVCLSQALQLYAMQFLIGHSYEPIQTPYMMKKDAMANVAQQSQFDEELYKVSGKWMTDKSAGDDSDSKYLIATSEQPLAAMYSNEYLELKDGPLRCAGFSTCFRQEAGSHGKDTRGIFRVHQFEKIEQFIYCAPDDSWSEFDRLIEITTEFYNSLQIPFRIVSIVSKELNNAAALKYDFEGYFPGTNSFKELVSCSSCTDYQSRGANIRYGVSGSAKAPFIHMLNSTLCAITRTMCILLEINQTDKGVNVPLCLQKFMPPKFKEFIPFQQSI